MFSPISLGRFRGGMSRRVDFVDELFVCLHFDARRRPGTRLHRSAACLVSWLHRDHINTCCNPLCKLLFVEPEGMVTFRWLESINGKIARGGRNTPPMGSERKIHTPREARRDGNAVKPTRSRSCRDENAAEITPPRSCLM